MDDDAPRDGLQRARWPGLWRDTDGKVFRAKTEFTQGRPTRIAPGAERAGYDESDRTTEPTRAHEHHW